MATVSERTRDPLAVPPWTTEAKDGSKSDQYLARRFASASADFKSMALATFLLAFAVAAVLWLLVGVLVEHWLVPGGLPDPVRWAWFVVGLAAAVWACGKWLLPLVRYRVNLVFAARELERGHPDLHNDLVNAVLVKEHSGDAAEAVVKSLRRRAARRLSSVGEEGIVDRTPAVRLAWALTALVCGMIVYAVLAPKSVITSAARLAAPWKQLVPPARVQIERPRLAWRMPGEDGNVAGADRSLSIVDGKAELVRGRQLHVASMVSGLETDERPILIVTPLRDDGSPDASLAPWRLAMTGGSDDDHTALVPGPDRGLDSSVDLQIAAGDGRSERVRVHVVDAPSLLVREVRYDYPEYMARDSEILPWQGDIRAIEGTRVTVIAEANRPLDVAAIDLGCDGRRNVSLALDRPQATIGKASFVLEFNADRTGPKFASYRFIYRAKAAPGQPTEPDVISLLEHRIEVMPDLAPEVAIEAPEGKVLRVPPDAPVTVRVKAMDPDFGLTKVHVETRLDGGDITQGDELLAGRPRLAFHGAATLVPQSLGAKPGNKLEYRAVAIDTRPDLPNRTVTEWQMLEIDASAPPHEQPPKDDDGGQEGGEGQPQDQGQGKQRGQGQEGQGEPGDDQGDAGGNQKGEGEGKSQDAQGAGDQGQGNQGHGQAAEGQGEQGEGQQGDGQSGQAAGDEGQGQQGEGKQGDGKGHGQGQQEGQGQKGEGERSDGRGEQEGKKGEGEKGDGTNGRDGSGQPAEGKAARGKQGAGQPQGQGEQPQGQGQQRPGEQQGQGAGKSQPSQSKPVASDGTDDGEAIERILENRREQGEGQTQDGGGNRDNEVSEGPQEQGQGQGREQHGQGQQSQPGQGEQGEGQQPGQGKQGKQSQQGDGEPGGGQGASDEAPGEPQPGQGQDGEQSQDQSGQGQDGQGQQGEGKQGEGKQGEGKAGKGQQPGEGQPGQGEQGKGEQAGQGQGQKGEGREGQSQDGQGQQGQGQQEQPGKQGEGQQGQAAGQRGQGAGEGAQPGGQSESGGESQSAGEGDGQGGHGGRGDASDGRGGDGEAQPLERREMQWTNQDLEHARNAANLAIEHLRDSLAKGRTDVLDDLGWTPEQARAFLERWQQMQQQAAQGDPRQRAEFEKAVKSLGLRPDGVQSSRALPTDHKGGQAEGRRSRPPSDYREQFKAFMQGTSVE
jgi:hypothetical protein